MCDENQAFKIEIWLQLLRLGWANIFAKMKYQNYWRSHIQHEKKNREVAELFELEIIMRLW